MEYRQVQLNFIDFLYTQNIRALFFHVCIKKKKTKSNKQKINSAKTQIIKIIFQPTKNFPECVFFFSVLLIHSYELCGFFPKIKSNFYMITYPPIHRQTQSYLQQIEFGSRGTTTNPIAYIRIMRFCFLFLIEGYDDAHVMFCFVYFIEKNLH